MAASGPLPTVFGLLLVAGGAGLLFFALHTHDERADEAIAQAAASASAAAEAARAAARRAPPVVVPSATATHAPPVATGLAASAPSASASAAPSGSASASAPGDAGAPADGGKADGGEPAAGPVQADVFHFTKGGIVLPKEELTRLVNLAKELRQKGGGTITIEGYGDEGAAPDASALLARRRATVVRQLFGDIGFNSDRLMMATPDAGGDASLLGSIRVRMAAVPGAEGKSP